MNNLQKKDDLFKISKNFGQMRAKQGQQKKYIGENQYIFVLIIWLKNFNLINFANL